ncbi:hypothetical protein FS749_012317 [Ceratobasidium sp. UAMH 11750]|nr:hypothetical protein FS749_012317 [Ceratobasidium sp. UAMH 11750]
MSFFTLHEPDPPSPVPTPELLPARAPSAASYRPVTPVSMTDPNSKSPTPFVQDGKGSSLLSQALRQEQQQKRLKRWSTESEETNPPKDERPTGTTTLDPLPRKRLLSIGDDFFFKRMFNPTGTSSPRPKKRMRSGLTL